MGNSDSKSSVENQQLIMQLQQQLQQQQFQQHQQQQHHQQQFHHQQNHSPVINPVISPAELQRGVNPYARQQEQMQSQNSNSTSNSSSTSKLLEILGNKEMMKEIDKNPSTKRKFLEKLLNNHRHMMTNLQVTRITNMLNNLPPENNNDSTKYAFQNIHQPQQDLVNPARKISAKNYEENPARKDSAHKEGSSREYAASSQGFNQGTTPRDNKNRQLQTTQQLNTIDALTKHYKTEAEEEEAYFKIEEERRRKDFEEKQKHRRMQYQASLTELEKSDIDALRLFQLQKNYTIDDLKIAYKKLAMKTHPDKTGGSAEQFQLVTKCYMSLLEKYKNRESDKPFNDLRDGSKTYIEDQIRSRMKNKNMESHNKSKNKLDSYNESEKVDKTKFDNKLFNKIYEQNKLWESGDDGYGDWFTSDKSEEAPEEVFGNKFNINVFNSTFEDYKEKLTSKSGAIQEYKDPQELVSGSTSFTDIDIFARKINDFSKPLPVARGGKNDLAYTDLKTAYTNKGAFIDPNSVEYKEYKNVDELKRDRSNIRYVMTPEQMRDYELKKRREIEEEEKRQDLIRQRDNVVSSTYSKTHEKMLGYRGTAGY
jgi:curved DNA-binding protein CbpA